MAAPFALASATSRSIESSPCWSDDGTRGDASAIVSVLVITE